MLKQAAITADDFGIQVRELLPTTSGAVDSPLPSVGKPPAPPVIAAIAVPYTHTAMIELMIAHPEYTHAQFARAFGRPPQWFSSVLASKGFQEALEPRRCEIADPGLAATLEERMRALAMQSLEVLQGKLSATNVQDATILKALEIGTKSLGMGASAPVLQIGPVQAVGPDAVAERILAAMAKAKQRSQNLQAIDVPMKEVPDAG